MGLYSALSSNGLLNHVEPGVNDHVNGELDACTVYTDVTCQDSDFASEMYCWLLPWVVLSSKSLCMYSCNLSM